MAGNDSFTKVLLHFDGANGSTSFPDTNAGGSAHTWTASGDAKITTSQSKFGTGSCIFDGTGDTVTAPDSADWSIGGSDFTVDCWFNLDPAGNGTFRSLFGTSNATANGDFTINGYFDTSNKLTFRASLNGTSFTVLAVASTAISSAGWHHAAMVRTGNVMKLFLDGTQEGGDQAMVGSMIDPTSVFGIGATGAFSGNLMYGCIDEFRLSVGIARWTSNFTPPTAAYGIDTTLTAAVASLALTGRANTRAISRATAVAAFAYTARAVTLAHNRFLTAAVAAVTLTGKAVTWGRGKFSSTGAFTLTGRSANKAVTRLTSGIAFALTGRTSTRGISRQTARASFTLTAMANLLSVIAGPVQKIRSARFVLGQSRTSQPILSNKRIR